MLGVIELLDVEGVIFKLNHSPLIIVHIAIVGGTEDGDYDWEVLASIPTVHLVALQLSLMSPNDRDKVILLEEFVG